MEFAHSGNRVWPNLAIDTKRIETSMTEQALHLDSFRLASPGMPDGAGMRWLQANTMKLLFVALCIGVVVAEPWWITEVS